MPLPAPSRKTGDIVSTRKLNISDLPLDLTTVSKIKTLHVGDAAETGRPTIV
ncbi:hypothetical protein RAB80_016461 [Fusarium oxysporum f. sp. vasinfectum]|nr:hypothetical protein RAB80_016461 [Fusarium oxysporum f. sp. vasinfectum]KAK2931864.1 hypothetical protein FoTM2_009381 [Fusarium oxysporum f. sp. vasinfectum]